MDELIDRLDNTFRTYQPEHYELPPRGGFAYTTPVTGLLEWMPIMHAGNHITLKIVRYHPANPDRTEMPTILCSIGSYNTDSGHLVGLADGTFLTALRTGAASAVASEALARPNATVLGVIGLGAQAVSQVHAISRRFTLTEVLGYDSDELAMQTFAERVAPLVARDTEIKFQSAETIVQSSDIICTCTSIDAGAGPLFDDTTTKPWLHINAIGSDFPGKTELPRPLLERGAVIPDFREQAEREGECQQLSPDAIGPELSTLLKQQVEHSGMRDRLTVFDSTGYALEDHVAMDMLLEYCEDAGIGDMVQLESSIGDPRNPYDFGLGRRERQALESAGDLIAG